ncbi:MAG TPA: hypothetical protein VMR25_12750 [Planctomycetaceae bacterium]|nr:hypothetical protein [Planctomycetaceae bacterium]
MKSARRLGSGVFVWWDQAAPRPPAHHSRGAAWRWAGARFRELAPPYANVLDKR